MIEAVEWSLEVRPEVEVLQHWIGFQRREFFGGMQGLKVRFSDQGGAVAGALKALADGWFAFRQLGAQGIGAVLGRVFAGDQAAAGGCAGGVGAIGAGEGRALGGEPVEGGCLDFRVELSERIPMLLVGGDQQDI